METETPEDNQSESAPTDAEWEQRVLCSDGNCIGVIGSDGHCKECGKKYEGTLPEDHFLEKEEPPADDISPADDVSPADDISPEKEDPSLDDMPHEAAENDDWQDRVLCSDGNCIGVIGPDGRCKECGKLYDENSDD